MSRPLARPLGALTAVIALANGCGDGTSGWVLTRDPPPSLANGSAAGTNGAGLGGLPGGATSTAGSSQGGNDGGSAGDTPVAGMGGEGATGPLDPSAFAEVCSPIVTIDNRTSGGNGQLFVEALAEPEAFMIAAARLSCSLLYRLPAEVPVTN